MTKAQLIQLQFHAQGIGLHFPALSVWSLCVLHTLVLPYVAALVAAAEGEGESCSVNGLCPRIVPKSAAMDLGSWT